MDEDGAGSDGARGRARETGERARGLTDRLARLERDHPEMSGPVARARLAAENALERGAEAHESAARAHRSAAEAQRSAARLAETAGAADRAAQHRRAAEDGEAAARVDDNAARGDRGTDQADEPGPTS